MVSVTMHGDSDIGRVRRINEDSFRLIPACPAAVVCDGMGGHAAGEVASQRAVETLAEYLLRGPSIAPPPDDMIPAGAGALPDEARELVWAVRLANRRVYQTAQSQRQMRGMGTTLVAMRFVPGYAIICHVGDSRAYRFRGGHLAPMTIDHSLVAELVAQNEITPEQARTFADRNIITRALGTRPVVAVDVSMIPLRSGDWFILCTDGLSGTITDAEIEAILSRRGQTAARAVGELIAAANAAGGPDNITVAIAEIRDVSEPVDGDERRETVPEPSEAIADQEGPALDALFPDVAKGAPLVEAKTDKIRIDPSLFESTPASSGAPEVSSTESNAPRRRGLWPWKNGRQ